MIRPVTVITAGLALASGLYLYHAKNAVLMLDRKIERIARETMAVGEHTRLLHAEWTLLNDPERLRHFSDRYLALKPLAPGQFTSLADLGARLPPPRAPEPDPPPTPATLETTVPSAKPPPETEEPAPAIVAEEMLPIPPIPVPPPPLPAARPTAPVQLATPQPVAPAPAPARPAEPAVAATGSRQPIQAQALPPPQPARGAEPRPAETRLADARGGDPRSAARPPLQGAPAGVQTPRPVVPAPIPVAAISPAARAPVAPSPVTQAAATYAPPMRQQPAAYRAPVPAPTPIGGSFLGGAQRGGAVPLPRPTPYQAPILDGGG